MPIYYGQIKRNNISYYKRIDESIDGTLISESSSFVPLKLIKRDDKIIFLLYNDKMTLIEPACFYLNDEISHQSMNSKTNQAYHLRLLYIFFALSGYDIESFDKYAVESFIQFLIGGDYRPGVKNNNSRSHETVNNILATIRCFFQYLGSNDSPLLESVRAKVKNDVEVLSVRKYKSSLKVNPHKHDTVQPYITPQQFLQLTTLAKEQNDEQSVILFHLMYFYGLRLGECLGLTEEDIAFSYKNGTSLPSVILRNRLSDHPDQLCKGLGRPGDVNAYERKDYIKVPIIITRAFFEKLTAFAEKQNRLKKQNGWEDLSIADRITKNKDRIQNHYLFINRRGCALRRQTWANSLRRYFIQIGLPVDNGKRSLNNLSHRFRHGCAMFYLHFAEPKCNLEYVSRTIMRHKELSTTAIYMRQTPEEDYAIKEHFQAFLTYQLTPHDQ